MIKFIKHIILYFKKPVSQDPLLILKPDFNKDIEYLNFIIVNEIEDYLFKLKLANKKVITDNDCIEGIKSITENILGAISINYRKLVIEKYINENYVDEFIIKLITKKIVEVGLSYNKKLYRNED